MDSRLSQFKAELERLIINAVPEIGPLTTRKQLRRALKQLTDAIDRAKILADLPFHK